MRNSWSGLKGMVIGLITVLCVGSAQATTLTLDLTNDSIVGDTLMVDVVAQYDDGGDPATDLVEFQIDVSASSANLTTAGTDFSRFSFALSPNAPFDMWVEVNNFADPTPDVSPAMYDNDFGAAPGLDDTMGGTVLLGTLSVDLAGLTGGPTSTVSINFVDAFFGTYASTDDGVDLLDVDTINFGNSNGEFIFTTPGGGTGGADVPEPATAITLLGAVAACAGRRRVRR